MPMRQANLQTWNVFDFRMCLGNAAHPHPVSLATTATPPGLPLPSAASAPPTRGGGGATCLIA